ncbi:UNVERIFIED_CONTAM: hypothetical protein RMT77_005917 [Armadillidium vulgare]
MSRFGKESRDTQRSILEANQNSFSGSGQLQQQHSPVAPAGEGTLTDSIPIVTKSFSISSHQGVEFPSRSTFSTPTYGRTSSPSLGEVYLTASGSLTGTRNSLENSSVLSAVSTSPSGGSAGSSPQVGRKIAKTWRQMGDKTKIRTRDILKKWQSLANGHAHSHPRSQQPTKPTEAIVAESTESVDTFGLPPPKIEKPTKTWKVYVWYFEILAQQHHAILQEIGNLQKDKNYF